MQNVLIGISFPGISRFNYLLGAGDFLFFFILFLKSFGEFLFFSNFLSGMNNRIFIPFRIYLPNIRGNKNSKIVFKGGGENTK